MNEYALNYLGKTYNTTIHQDLTDEEYNQIVKEYYTKPDFSLVKKQMQKVNDGGVRTNYITNYYFKDLMAKVKHKDDNWCIEEALQSKEVMEFFAGKTANNKKVFPEKKTLCQNIETAFRLCGFKTARKPANYPIKSVDEILKYYNVNGKYLDYSCGWGSRLMSSLRNRVEYYGIDPNTILCDRLDDLIDDWRAYTGNWCYAHIYNQGSENFIPELKNKIGVAFSSPPYYNMEDYKIGDQSWHEGVSYEDWLNNYMRPTIENIKEYLIDDGYFIINVKAFDKYDLPQDVYDIATSLGFTLVNIMELNNITRCSGHKEWPKGEICWHDNNEKIFVYQKGNSID